MPDDLDGELAELMVVAVAERLRRSDHYRLAGVDAQRVEVLHVADSDAVVEAVAHHLILHLLPSAQRLLDEHLRREGECLLHCGEEFLLIVAEAGAQTAEGVCGPDNHGVAETLSGLAGCLRALHRLALDGLDVDLVELLHEFLAVFGVDDGLHRSAEHLHAVFLQHAVVEELHSAVECRLAAEGEHDAVGTLLLDHLLYEIRGHWKEIYVVGHAFRSLHRGDVGIDQYCLYALFTEGLEGLRARIVEFTGLADLQCPGAEQKHFLYTLVSVCFHICFQAWGLKKFYKIVKQEFRVGRPRGGLRVELRRKPRVLLMADTLVGAVVHIDEEGFPVFGECR